MLTYSELSDLCATREISLTELAETCNMTLRGFRDAINNNTLSARAIIPICIKLGIAPNDFLSWDKKLSTYNSNQVGVFNTQNIGSAGIEILQQQLQTKDEQIKQLLQLLNKK